MKIDTALCVVCGTCVDTCVVKHLALVDNILQETDIDCLHCGHCMAVCPQKAIALDGVSYDDLLEYSKKDMHVDPAQLLRLMEYKRSMRLYQPKTVEPEKLKMMLRAAQYSPTIGNWRTMRCIVLNDKKDDYARRAMEILVDAKKAGKPQTEIFTEEALTRRHDAVLNGNDLLFFHAPLVILIVDEISKDQPGANAYIAASRMEMAAESLGLGSCYVGLFTKAVCLDRSLQQELGIRENEEAYVALAIGYPAWNYLRTVSRPALKVEWQ